MTPNEKSAFLAALSRTFRTVHKPLPDAEVLGVWWVKLEPYPLEMVASALSKHLDVSDFAPTPAAILRQLPTRRDEYLEADEAWAIAVLAADEDETVVWTHQIAEGWANAQTLFNRGDEVGARMAFKATYTRLVAQAIAIGQPALWRISYGADPERRQQAAERAVRDGRLQLEQILGVLPPPNASRNGWHLLARSGDHPGLSGVGDEHLTQLMKFLGLVTSAGARIATEKSQKAQAQREQLRAKKRVLAEQVRKYRWRQRGGKS